MASVAAAEVDARIQVRLPDLLALRAQAARLRLPVRQSRAPAAGPQASRLYGRGMDYAESRAYQPGDDVRRLDWRLTARSGKLHTKLFQEEREGRLMVLVDTHASLHFGTRVRFKSVQVARAAALAAWYAVRAGERVGGMAFGARRQVVRAQAGPRGALALCGALVAWDAPAPGEEHDPLSAAAARAARLPQRASRWLVITDGASCDTAAATHLRELQRTARVAVLIVADALEREPPPPGRYPLEHGGVRREVDLLAERQRLAFQRSLGAGVARLSAIAQAQGLPCRVIGTADDPGEAVAALLGAPGR